MALVGGAALELVLGRRGVNNLWVGYVSTPAGGILLMLGLAHWQRSVLERGAIRAAIPVYLLAWAGLVAIGEDTQRFSVVAFPLHALLLLALCLWTLGRNALEEERQPLLRADWFWVGVGFALINGAAAAIEPLSVMLVHQDRVNLLVTAFNLKAGIDLAGTLSITLGMLCPLATAPSGPSSSPRP
ncbi:MAG: hypothetical protein L0Z62_00335 [Gemmataceae bacterium]|nr:hypothetical protein [Gemmataceae bacterium]